MGAGQSTRYECHSYVLYIHLQPLVPLSSWYCSTYGTPYNSVSIINMHVYMYIRMYVCMYITNVHLWGIGSDH